MKKIITIILGMTVSSAFSQCACCAGAGIGSSNADYNNGILTLDKNQFLAETYLDYRTVQEGKAMEDDEKLLQSMYISSAGIRYGITNNITVSGLLPYVFLKTSNGDDNGAGDFSLLATFNLFNKNNLNIALQAGIELPTGIQKNSNFDNTTVVIGSGSYDPMGGLIISKRINKFTIQCNGLFKYTTEGFHGNYYSNVATHNLSCSYNLKAVNSCFPSDSVANRHSDFGCNIFLSYYGEWLDKIKEDGEVDENSGYYSGFTSLGTTISFKKWSFPLTLSLPVIQEMNGLQNDSGYRIRIGIIKSFN